MLSVIATLLYECKNASSPWATERSFQHSTPTLVIGKGKWVKNLKIWRISSLKTCYLSIARCGLELKNVRAMFQRAMYAILATVKRIYAIAYPDHVVVFSQTPSQHIGQTAIVLRLMKSTGPYLQTKKMFLFLQKLPTILSIRYGPELWKSWREQRTQFVAQIYRLTQVIYVYSSVCVICNSDAFLILNG